MQLQRRGSPSLPATCVNAVNGVGHLLGYVACSAQVLQMYKLSFTFMYIQPTLILSGLPISASIFSSMSHFLYIIKHTAVENKINLSARLK